MNISKTTAMSIVNELKDIIQYDITLMDDSCHIIACTERERIGDYHAATRKMLSENLPLLVVRDDYEYEGTHMGINLPIEVDGQVAGVIGITGEYQEVEKYGRIIKKMAEILLLDEYQKEQKRLSRSARSRFIQDWIFNDTISCTDSFTKRGLQMGIDISMPRRIAVAIVEKPDYQEIFILDDQTVMDEITHTISKLLTIWRCGFAVNYGSNFILLLKEESDEQLTEVLEKIGKNLWEQYQITWKVGVDSYPVSCDHAAAGYQRADKALRRTYFSVSMWIAFYKDITMEIFIKDITEASKSEFIFRIFNGYSREEIQQWIKILKTLFECNGSLMQTSERLFMHKNTLQYRLNKLHEQTGFDPRSMTDSPLYYVAIVFFEDIFQKDGSAANQRF